MSAVISSFARTLKPRNSVWGLVQQATEHAPGMWFVSTASHGGFMLSEERFQAMHPAFRCNTYGGMRNFEEDCEVSLVIAAFPECFTAEQVEQAKATIAYLADGDAGYRRAHAHILHLENAK